jgi:sortase A
MLRRWSTWLLVLALVAGTCELGQGAYIHAKAWVAQQLIASSWQRTLHGEKAVKPWPWADTWPVAQLSAPAQEVRLYVLAGASGRTLAFGPGHVDGTAIPGMEGNVVLSGHRDTHFRFLQTLRIGSALELQAADGTSHRYRVTHMQIVDKSDTRVLLPSQDAQLTLVTCYPFDALVPGGPLRYVVVAHEVS